MVSKKNSSVLHFAYLLQFSALMILLYIYIIVNFFSLLIFFLLLVIFLASVSFKEKTITLFRKPFEYWISLGNFMGKISSFVILLIIFIFIFLPTSIFFKLIKRDTLEKTPDKTRKSYWIKRTNPPESLYRQF